MIITHKFLTSNTLKIFVARRIDVLNADYFKREVAKISSGVSKIIFDLSAMDYISSAGLREFLICRKKSSRYTNR